MCLNLRLTFALPLSVYEDETYNKLRRGYIILIASFFKYFIEQDDDIKNYETTIINIEKSCYEDALDIAEQELLPKSFDCSAFEYLYRTRVMRITKNLDINSEVHDNHLIEGLMNGTIDALTVSKLENKDLSPSKNNDLLEELNTRLNQEVKLKTSSLYRCNKCGHKETTIQIRQMRSLDEASTLIITCTFCHYKWFSS